MEKTQHLNPCLDEENKIHQLKVNDDLDSIEGMLKTFMICSSIYMVFNIVSICIGWGGLCGYICCCPIEPKKNYDDDFELADGINEPKKEDPEASFLK